MKCFSLFCKSYAGDLTRVINLCDSVNRFNKDNIPLYICVPKKDLELFQSKVLYKHILWLTDEEVISLNPSANLDFYKSWDGRLSQQVVKAEFWRYLKKQNSGSSAYLCLDSESQFIRDFYLSDFLSEDQNPYTVLHQNKELLQLASNKKIDKFGSHFFRESAALKKIFNRVGPDYDFGPTPAIWSSKVWSDLDEKYLKPNGMSFWDAIKIYPSELRWYGEALLEYKSIRIQPIEPIFRVYHYDWQYFFLRKSGEAIETLCKNYLGILKQSNWDYEMDYGDHAKRKSFLSRQLRKVRRFFARLK